MTDFYPYFHPAKDIGRINVKSSKLPMLVVGTSNYVRQNYPSLYDRDTYIFFLPTSEAKWRIGLISFRKDGTILSSYSDGVSIQDTILGAFGQVPKELLLTEKLKTWCISCIYRCPKISLRDILHLAPYQQEESA